LIDMATPRRKFKPSEPQMKYAMVYAEHPEYSRRQVAEAVDIPLERVSKWYSTASFTSWLLSITQDRIDQAILATARRRVAIDMMKEGKVGSETALKVYLREIDKKNNANFTKGKGDNPLNIVLQVGSDAGSKPLHPVAQDLENAVEDADYEVKEKEE